MKGKLTLMMILLAVKVLQGQSFMSGFQFNPKAGIYSSNNAGGFSLGVELNTTYRGLIYSIDFIRVEEFNLFSDYPGEYSNQVGIMAGKAFGTKFFKLQLQGGAAPFWGLRRTTFLRDGWFGDEYNAEKFLTVGLLSKLGLKFTPGSDFAIGIDLQSNLNPINSVIMPMLSIEIGNARIRNYKNK